MFNPTVQLPAVLNPQRTTDWLVRTLMVFVMCLSAHSLAQEGPAGNEHPESQTLTQVAEDLPPPFGAPQFNLASVATPQQKLAFAESLDLEPLRGVAVFHNGRIKILDTLAIETVSTIVGRRTYTNILEIDGKPQKISFDPVFTLMDLVIDPAYYLNKPLLYVNFLPLRELFLEAAFPNDPLTASRWSALTRISPLMAEEYGPALSERHMFTDTYRQGFAEIRSAAALWERSGDNMLLVAPASVTDRWHHVSEEVSGAEVRAASAELGRAWRVMDAAAANSAISRLADAVKGINTHMYPTSRVDLELAYNRFRAFDWGMWIYLVSAVSLILAFATGRGWLVKVGIATLMVAIVMHALGFGLRCVIAERFAIQNQFESMTGVSLFASLAGVVLMLVRKQWLYGAAAAATGFLILTAATQTGIPGVEIEREAAILNTSVLLKYHVTTVLTSYGLITLGFVISLFLLGSHYANKWRGGQSKAVKFPSGVNGEAASGGVTGAGTGQKTHARMLSDLDTAQMTVLQLAFWTLGVGVLLGAWWADHSWGRWWAWDPKETWALLTWIIYLIVIHVRHTIGGTRKGVVTAWLSALGFVVMLWTYFGVNLLLPGLHAYA
jgi:cytochrome c-type biogenesis protein CcsB